MQRPSFRRSRRPPQLADEASAPSPSSLVPPPLPHDTRPPRCKSLLAGRTDITPLSAPACLAASGGWRRHSEAVKTTKVAAPYPNEAEQCPKRFSLRDKLSTSRRSSAKPPTQGSSGTGDSPGLRLSMCRSLCDESSVSIGSRTDSSSQSCLSSSGSSLPIQTDDGDDRIDDYEDLECVENYDAGNRQSLRYHDGSAAADGEPPLSERRRRERGGRGRSSTHSAASPYSGSASGSALPPGRSPLASLAIGLDHNNEEEPHVANFLLEGYGDMRDIAGETSSRLDTPGLGPRNELAKMKPSAKLIVGRRATARFTRGFKMRTFMATASVLGAPLESSPTIKVTQFFVQLDRDSGFLMMTRKGRAPKRFPLQQVTQMERHINAVESLTSLASRRCQTMPTGNSPQSRGRLWSFASNRSTPKSSIGSPAPYQGVVRSSGGSFTPSPVTTTTTTDSTCRQVEGAPAPSPTSAGCTTGAPLSFSSTLKPRSRRSSTCSVSGATADSQQSSLFQLSALSSTGQPLGKLKDPCAVLHLRSGDFPLVCLLPSTRKRNDFLKLIRFLQTYFYGRAVARTSSGSDDGRGAQ